MMSAFDLPAVKSIAEAVHPSLYEAPEVLAERQRLYPHGCYLLEIGERPAGYVLSHPWRAGTLPRLNTRLGALPAEPTSYYLHDLAVLPLARRVGAGSRIVEALGKHARAGGYQSVMLVAAGGSQGFWERHGFRIEDAPQLRDELRSYEPGARLMVKRLANHEI
jgi:ribosomal protein S18 acetylase RimI-like enzyme